MLRPHLLRAFFTAKKGPEGLIDFEQIDIGAIQSSLGQYFTCRGHTSHLLQSTTRSRLLAVHSVILTAAFVWCIST